MEQEKEESVGFSKSTALNIQKQSRFEYINKQIIILNVDVLAFLDIFLVFEEPL